MPVLYLLVAFGPNQIGDAKLEGLKWLIVGLARVYACIFMVVTC